MAIQNRRGDYDDFDPTKMKPGEFAVVQDNDPVSSDGYGVYMAFGAGQVKRLSTTDELHSYDEDARMAAQDAEASRASAQTILTLANRALSDAELAKQAAQSAASDAEELINNAIDTISEAIDAETEEAVGEITDDYNAKMAEMTETYNARIAEINRKGDQIVSITTNAETIAAQALSTANNAENHMSSLDNQMQALEAAMQNVSIDPDDLGLEQDPDTYYVYPTYKGIRSENGIPLAGGGGGGGGGGGDVIAAVLTVTNTSGWISKTIADGSSCPVSFYWSSIENEMSTGDGTLRITVNEVVRASMQIQQGNVSVDLAPYLSAGTNKVKVRIADTYDQGKTTTFNITSVTLALTSSFDTTQPYTSAFAFPCTPVGNVEKTIHVLIDGREAVTQVTSLTNRQISISIPAQTHGGHSLEAYFTAEINGESVSSNHLYYEFIYTQPLNDTVIITSSFNTASVSQYSSVAIPFTVYDPKSLTADALIFRGDVLVSAQTVDRTEQSYTIRVNDTGSVSIRIVSGESSKTITFTVTPSEIDVEAETQDLALYLTAQGRSNNEADPAVWEYEDIAAVFDGFTWRLDGWQTDDDDITVMRLSDSARITIPYEMFAQDCKSTGKTVEIEFATRDVIDYSATILECVADGIGLSITPQMVSFAGAQTSISTLYKDNEHLRLSIVVEKQSDNRLILIYINGIMSRAIQYASGERFSQLSPVGISIGSDDCGIDIYNIRVYDNNLNRQQVLDNWIADTQVGAVMLERYGHNNVYDAYGNITPANLPADLPYFIFEAEELPQFKGDKKTITGSYTDVMFPSKGFTFTGCEIDVQGTSSAPYYRKNYDMKFKEGFITPNGLAETYAIRTGSIPFNRFVIKADVASSESANNTGLTMFYNDTCPYKTPEMLLNSKVRWGIEGIPIALFWHSPVTGQTQFMGKYNFNLPKRCPAPLGYSGNQESWEWERNNSANVKFQDDDFSTQTWDEVGQKWFPEWYNDFEARFPSDEWRDTAKLGEMLAWVKSTWRDAATGDALGESVTYRLPSDATLTPYPSDSTYTAEDEYVDGQKTGIVIATFTADTPAYRLSKFRAEFADYFEVQSATFYYLFTEMFLMIDSRAKNMFIGFHGSDINEEGRAMDRKAVFEPYDMDTAIGTNNSGVLMFGYGLEDTDTVSSIISGGDEGGSNAPVFNAQDSVLWMNFRDSFRSEINTMYRSLRTNGDWSYRTVKERFENHQAKWCEAIYNEDAFVKYLTPLIDPVTFDEDTGQYIRTDRYLTMLQGSKAEQRKWWLSNRFRYMDSKFVTGDAAGRIISMRLFNGGNLWLTPAIDMYVGVSFGGGTNPELIRTTANTPVHFTYTPGTGVTEMETWVYSADLITDVGDLSVFYGNEFDFSRATRLQRLKIGSEASGYSNANLVALDVRNSALLEHIDVRNCPRLAITVNLEGSPRLKEAYFDGTAITGIDLADGCTIETLHLPGTITTLTLINLSSLEEFVCPDFSNVSRVMLTNIDTDVVDPLDILEEIPANSQVNIQGLYLECADAQEIEDVLDLFDTMRGVSREKNTSGEWMYHDYDTAQISGTIHTAALTGEQIASYNARYPYINVTATSVTSYLKYASYDGSTVYKTVTCLNGVPQDTAPADPSRTATAQYTFTFVGWSRNKDASTAQSDAAENVIADRTIYAAYSRTVRSYTVYWKNYDNTTLETDTNVPYGTMPSYDGATPTYQGQTSTGWMPQVSTVTGNITYTAMYIPIYRVRFYNDDVLLQTVSVQEGDNAVYTGETPTSTAGEFLGWDPDPVNVMADMDCNAMFDFVMAEPDLKYLVYTTDDVNMTMTITGLNTANIVADRLSYITIPDTINGYHVIIG